MKIVINLGTNKSGNKSGDRRDVHLRLQIPAFLLGNRGQSRLSPVFPRFSVVRTP